MDKNAMKLQKKFQEVINPKNDEDTSSSSNESEYQYNQDFLSQAQGNIMPKKMMNHQKQNQGKKSKLDDGFDTSTHSKSSSDHFDDDTKIKNDKQYQIRQKVLFQNR